MKLLRTKVYVDGYDLYYGCLKGTQHKWLDLYLLFRDRILPSSAVHQSELLGIKFFTAPILEKASKSLDSVSSQSRYHTALEKRYPNEIEVIKGYYSLSQSKVKIVDAENPNKWARECEEILVWKVEEKQTDVNLALHAYHDAITGIDDQVVIVTNDTDIAPRSQHDLGLYGSLYRRGHSDLRSGTQNQCRLVRSGTLGTNPYHRHRAIR
jgi:6-hydroxy-3-succinoylpyridine 3-monooxygenase